MKQTTRRLDPGLPNQALAADLQRRIEVMGQTKPHTFGRLEAAELLCLALVGIAGPFVLAWWLL